MSYYKKLHVCFECGTDYWSRKASSSLCEKCDPDKDKMCAICGNKFISREGSRRYCSYQCRMKAEKLRYVSPKQWPGMSTGKVGAIQELRASVDLMIKGWEVYRAVSPSSSCDLLALKDGVLIKIEVRTGSRSKNKRLAYPRGGIRAEYVAVALPNEIIYVPELPSAQEVA